MAATKRAYKLQEFVAHSSNVNCLKIGRKTSRVLVTGGEDHKVNVWAIGKPNAILVGISFSCRIFSLSGHMSAVESVSFDSSEVLVAAGATSGSIKLWDLEEAKSKTLVVAILKSRSSQRKSKLLDIFGSFILPYAVIRTLTGHRSNCIAVDFHPFGEFFASGSLDTNLKIWDMRRKGCIHTYKGHTRGINAIKFTPDGRWVVSGGEDNIIKLWDLTAGKLLHEFKLHEGQIQCIDFHPHEFLLATGSADKTVKFWDLETFELIGSSGPEASGVRSMTFNPDGRTFLCGLHESLKVFSWEPIVCHDNVDVGWSRLSDMNVHEGKLLGCSYNQSQKSTSDDNPSMPADNIKSSMRRLSILQSSETNSETKSLPGTPQRIGACASTRVPLTAPASVSSSVKRSLSKLQSTSNLQTNKADIVPVIVPRDSLRLQLPSDCTKDSRVGKTTPFDIQSKFTEFWKVSNIKENTDKTDISIQSGYLSSSNIEQNEFLGQTPVSSGNAGTQRVSADENHLDGIKNLIKGRIRSNSFREPRLHFEQENCKSDILILG
ncbi:hypothetical protein ZIOFF_072651 [Zingiber officinale]|uniref:Katanin p80 WD40 repeat-containing subunit B1 homolog n=1 Tax=Zingiber officinale TaxID=94328 RepID=A0A8J5BXJ9_ZINOF|nr:hypothetical protein ZIOFF_072651 [Zingiber officinale]